MAVVQDKLSMFDEGLEKVGLSLAFQDYQTIMDCVKNVSLGHDEPRTCGGENVRLRGK